MRVDELKSRIHKELFGARFPASDRVTQWNEQQKERVMLSSVDILRRHGQPEEAVLEMLEEKFLLTEEEARALLYKANHNQEGDKRYE